MKPPRLPALARAAGPVIVGLLCSCSGCGGFYYNDVVNRRHEADWYRGQGCRRTGACLRRCCPPRTLVCRKGQCAVIEGKRRRRP